MSEFAKSAPEYRRWFQAIVSSPDWVSTEANLRRCFGNRVMFKTLDPSSPDFQPLDADLVDDREYGIVEDCICHMPSQLLNLIGEPGSRWSDVDITKFRFRPMQLPILTDAEQILGCPELARQVYFVNVNIKKIDGAYRLVEVSSSGVASGLKPNLPA